MEKVLSILVAANLFAACSATDHLGKTELATTGLSPGPGLVVDVTCGNTPNVAGETATFDITFVNTSPCLMFFVANPALFFPGGEPAGTFFSLDPSATSMLEGRQVLTAEDVANGFVSFTLNVQTSPASTLCIPQSFQVGAVCQISSGGGEETEPCNMKTLTKEWRNLFKQWKAAGGTPDKELEKQGDAQLREARKLQGEGKHDEARAALEGFADNLSQDLEDQLAQEDPSGDLVMILERIRRCVRFLLGIDPGDWNLNPPNSGGHTFLSGVDPATGGPKPFSDKDKERILETLAKIPLPLGGQPTTFRRGGSNPSSPATWEPGGREVVIADEFFQAGPEKQCCILQHEFAHRYHQDNFNKVYGFLEIGWEVPGDATRPGDFIELKARSLSPKSGEPPILRDKKDEESPYDPIEDFGRSVELYVCDPETLKSQSPERYDWIKDNVFDGKEFPKK